MISIANAQDAAAAVAAGGMPAILNAALPFVLVFGVFYFVLLRPQMQNAKKHTEMVGGLKKGDVVVTDGGLIGEVVGVKDALLHVRVAEGVVLAVAKEAVRNILLGDAAKGWEAKVSAPVVKKR